MRVCVQYRTLYARALWRALRACMRARNFCVPCKSVAACIATLLVRLFGRGRDMLSWVLKGAQGTKAW